MSPVLFPLMVWLVLGSQPVRSAQEPVTADKLQRLVLDVSGSDLKGVRTSRRFMALPTGTAFFMTNAGDGTCASEAGFYEGKISQGLYGRLEGISRKIASAPAGKSDAPGRWPVGIATTLEALWSRSATVRLRDGANQDWRELELAVLVARQAFRPNGAVRMKVLKGSRSNKVEVEFRLIGTRPVRFLLPRDAAEAFRLTEHPEHTLIYSKRPAKFDLELTPKAPTVKVALKIKNPKQRYKSAAERQAKKLGGPRPKLGKPKFQGPLEYRNDLMRHHAKAPVPTGISLCSVTP